MVGTKSEHQYNVTLSALNEGTKQRRFSSRSSHESRVMHRVKSILPAWAFACTMAILILSTKCCDMRSCPVVKHRGACIPSHSCGEASNAAWLSPSVPSQPDRNQKEHTLVNMLVTKRSRGRGLSFYYNKRQLTWWSDALRFQTLRISSLKRILSTAPQMLSP